LVSSETIQHKIGLFTPFFEDYWYIFIIRPVSVSLSSFSCQCLPVLFAYNDYASIVTDLCVYVRPSLITSLPACLCYYLSECLSVSVSLHPFVRQPGFPSIHLSICPFEYLTVSLSVFPFVCLFFRPYIQLFVCPSIYFSVHST
jgi:hypothetical protein